MLVVIQRHLNEFLQNTPYECVRHEKYLITISRKDLRNCDLRRENLFDLIAFADLAWRMADGVLLLIKSSDHSYEFSGGMRMAISDPMLFKKLKQAIRCGIRGVEFP
jgi:hypothetical protein